MIVREKEHAQDMVRVKERVAAMNPNREKLKKSNKAGKICIQSKA